MADEQPIAAPVPTTDEQLDTALAGIMVPPADPKVETPLGEPPAEVTEVPLEDQLKTIEEADIKPDIKPALTPEQEKIFAVVPTPAVAEQLAQTAANYNNFTGAFERGDFAAVQGMFEAWNPAAFDGFLEHIYAQKVANGEWVDRWIADKEGNPTTNKAVTRLERQLAQLQSKLDGRSTQEQSAQQQQQLQTSYTNYNNHINGLFDHMKTPEGDRRWIASDIVARINANPTVRQQVMADPKAANGLFKTAYREYMQRDQATTQIKAGVLAQQEGKKPLLQSAAQPNAGLPENIKDVPKGKEDEWLTQELGNLYASGKKKR